MNRPRSCWNANGKHKMTWTSKSEAKKHARKWHTVYECRNCGFFHLTSH